MTSRLRELLEQAAEQQRRTWLACERIFDALGYYEEDPEVDADGRRDVIEAVLRVALARGTAKQRVELFRAQQTLKEKRARVGQTRLALGEGHAIEHTEEPPADDAASDAG